jgi:hypothetical protein
MAANIPGAETGGTDNAAGGAAIERMKPPVLFRVMLRDEVHGGCCRWLGTSWNGVPIGIPSRRMNGIAKEI